MSYSSQKSKPKCSIYPLTFVLKYEPPMIGMVYKSSEKSEKKRIYKIYLHDLIYKDSAEEITDRLLLEHAKLLNDNVISKKQVTLLSLY